jgi:hypothetical protein
VINLPTADIINAYRDGLKAVGVPVVLRIRQGDGTFVDHAARAMVKTFRPQDLIAGGAVQIGDFALIVLAEDVPGVTTMESRDRVVLNGREYGVIGFDRLTRSVAGHELAYDIVCRG